MTTELISLTTKCESKPVYEGKEFPVKVSETAVSELIKANAEDPQFIRVGVLGGGCSGYMFDLDFVKEPRESDFRKEFTKGEESVTLVVDPKSAYVLQGIELDYVNNKLGSSGFKFLGGDLVKRACGCGESFSI